MKQNLAKIVYSSLILWVLMWLIVINSSQLEIDKGRPYYFYMQNNTIRILYFSTIIVNLLFAYGIISFLIQKNWVLKVRNFKIYFLMLTLISIFLTWFEFYFSSTFYYGEVRDKQCFPFIINNFGILSNIMFSSYTFTYFEFRSFKKSSTKNIIYFVFIVVLLLINFIVFSILKVPWKMEGSYLDEKKKISVDNY